MPQWAITVQPSELVINECERNQDERARITRSHRIRQLPGVLLTTHTKVQLPCDATGSCLYEKGIALRQALFLANAIYVDRYVYQSWRWKSRRLVYDLSGKLFECRITRPTYGTVDFTVSTMLAAGHSYIARDK